MSKESWGLLAECEKRKGHTLRCASQDTADMFCGARKVISQYSITSFLISSNRDCVRKAVDPSCHIQSALAVNLTHKK